MGIENRSPSLFPPEGPEAESTGEQPGMGDHEAMQAFDATLLLAEEGTESDDEVAKRIATLLVEMKESRVFPHYFSKLDPDAYHQETKKLSEKARQRLRLALQKFAESLSLSKGIDKIA